MIIHKPIPQKQNIFMAIHLNMWYYPSSATEILQHFSLVFVFRDMNFSHNCIQTGIHIQTCLSISSFANVFGSRFFIAMISEFMRLNPKEIKTTLQLQLQCQHINAIDKTRKKIQASIINKIQQTKLQQIQLLKVGESSMSISSKEFIILFFA